MEYIHLVPKSDIVIDSIVSIHYFEYTKDFAFSGEVHDFWEFVYADKEELFITAGGAELLLKPNQFYLHRPMEFHNIRCNGERAANSVIVSFSSNSPALFSIAGRVIECGQRERRLMASVIREAKSAFSTPLGDPYTAELIRRSDSVDFGSEQLIRLYCEELMIFLIRGSSDTEAPDTGMSAEVPDERIGSIISFLESSTDKLISFGDICDRFSMSGSYLKKLFKASVGCGVMEYYSLCRIDKAKQLIREGRLNFCEIAEQLCFNSAQYFSRCFKNHTGMTPSEYEHSVFSMISTREHEAPASDKK